MREKTLRKNEDGGEITFIVIQMNVTSLCSSDRVEELAREVCDCRWDALSDLRIMETREKQSYG